MHGRPVSAPSWLVRRLRAGRTGRRAALEGVWAAAVGGAPRTTTPDRLAAQLANLREARRAALAGDSLAAELSPDVAFDDPYGVGHEEIRIGNASRTQPERDAADAPLLLGMNNLRLGVGDDLTGTLTTILDDVQTLGASVIRQLGHYDLLWDTLGPDDVALPKIPVDPDDLRDIVLRGANVTRIAELMVEAHRRGLRLHFQVFHIGGGGPAASDYTALNGVSVKAPVKVNWAEGHAENGRGSLPTDVLDLESGYDTAYLETFCNAVADLLRRALARAQDAVDAGPTPTVRPLQLEDVVYAIELVNEVSPRNVVWSSDRSSSAPDPGASARSWAAALYRMARALQTGFRDSGLEPPPIWLPGILSYGEVEPEGAGTANWSYILGWFSALCVELGALARADGVPPDEVFAGVDYHFYHTHGTPEYPPSPVPVLALIQELNAIRTMAALAGLGGLEITVSESGTRGEKADGALDYRPYGLEAEEFQAQEVWRRLLGAILAGASVAGIHTLMSAIPAKGAAVNSFSFFGLRLDDASVAHSTEARQRPAWFSYERLASMLLRYAESGRVRLLLPEGAEVIHTDPTGRFGLARADDLLIVECSHGSGAGWDIRRDFAAGAFPYLYVVHIDPWRGTGGSDGRIRVNYTFAGERGDIVLLGSEYTGRTEDPAVGALPLGAFPHAEVAYDSSSLPAPGSFSLAGGRFPSVVAASVPLLWSLA